MAKALENLLKYAPDKAVVGAIGVGAAVQGFATADQKTVATQLAPEDAAGIDLDVGGAREALHDVIS